MSRNRLVRLSLTGTTAIIALTASGAMAQEVEQVTVPQDGYRGHIYQPGDAPD